MLIPLALVSSVVPSVPLALCSPATVCRAQDRLLTCWMALAWLCALMVSLMRMVCVVLAMRIAVLVPSPVTIASLALPTFLFWWVRDADRSAPVAPSLVMECAVLVMLTVLNARVPLSSVPLVQVISPSFADRSVCLRALVTNMWMAMCAALVRPTVSPAVAPIRA